MRTPPAPAQLRRPPYVATTLATTLLLTLLGSFALAAWQGRALMTELRESLKLVIELRPNAGPDAVATLTDYLSSQEFVVPRSVEVISKEDGAAFLQEEYGDDFLDFDLENPLYDVVTVNLTEQAVTGNSLASYQAAVQQRPEVLGAYLQEDVISSLTDRLSQFLLFGGVTSVLLLLAVVALMLNTTRLALVAQSRTIKTMELVGASWGFISKPFLKRSAWLGLLAGIVATLLVIGLAAFAKTSLTDIWPEVPPALFALLGAVLIAVGVMLNFGSTFAVVRKTLRMRVDDLLTRG